MTGAVWAGAVGGALVKLISPRRAEGVSLVAYLALGWMILVGLRPMLGAVDFATLVLIVVGGVLYSIGAGFHLCADSDDRGQRFRSKADAGSDPRRPEIPMIPAGIVVDVAYGVS